MDVDMAVGDDGLTVGRTAEAVGISVRTLHHWDAIGLVTPAERTWSDYRVYSASDIARIQQVLMYRELGLSLSEVRTLLDDPDADVVEQLDVQRALLSERIDRLRHMVAAVDQMKEAHMSDSRLTAQQQAEILGDDWNPAWQDEAQENWGDTAEWDQAEKVRARMSADDFTRVKDELEQLEGDLAAAMTGGVRPGTDQANVLAERHRAQIGRWFTVSHQKQVRIARMYVQDPRFQEHYDARADGLAAWLTAIIDENARCQGIDPESATWE
ncbi:MerR family transcriptional regulator [Brevibacterium jeotgali]|uniref:DNA-binding transcriptional regulator, MerR family n=1 Tax=Brevibacterium jeotgali TaxID=1262550 RepID=A0A2H1L517_9MICO|nr:MerR family transcriptional regulator [Brevibacterium jeotgali]TWC01413.1 DNA-binding transcriptional MerR regulator [Brevibacterium jeotgali]SMY11982.1 DNA-binding transcriptional regulator, MerR family [Brevibacterium jeotgali]